MVRAGAHSVYRRANGTIGRWRQAGGWRHSGIISNKWREINFKSSNRLKKVFLTTELDHNELPRLANFICLI